MTPAAARVRRERSARAEVRATGAIRSPSGRAADVEVLASTSGVARDGGTIPVEAWDLEAYERNPVVMLSHGAGSAFPIATAVETVPSADGLRQFWRFHEHTPEAQTAQKLYAEGYMRAASVAFRLREWREVTGEEAAALQQQLGSAEPPRWIAQDAELLEVSAVAVPSDPDALTDLGRAMQRAAASGLDVRPLEPHLHRLHQRCEAGDRGACRRLEDVQRGTALATLVAVKIEDGELPETAVLEAAAEEAGVEVSEVEAVLQGEDACPTFEVLEALAAVLDGLTLSEATAAAAADGCAYSEKGRVLTETDGTRLLLIDVDGERLEVELAEGETPEELVEAVARRARLLMAGAHMPRRGS